ncbi:MAG: hypothetical protein R3C13_00390 [Hyphomonas sp.]|uniref:hypothetical protein n=1 Tax=Hyphomonas sp. TaxID=87 RepID=UPI0035292465
MSKPQPVKLMNRRGGRRPTEDAVGRIKLGWFKSVDCDIRDVSPGGARLVIPEGVELPEQFIMKTELFKTPKVCFRRWEYGGEIGVEFI